MHVSWVLLSSKRNQFLLGTIKLRNVVVVVSVHVKGNIFRKQLRRYSNATPVEGWNIHFHRSFAPERTWDWLLRCLYWEWGNCQLLWEPILNVRPNLLGQLGKRDWRESWKGFSIELLAMAAKCFWAIHKRASSCSRHEWIQSCKNCDCSFHYTGIEWRGNRGNRDTHKRM